MKDTEFPLQVSFHIDNTQVRVFCPQRKKPSLGVLKLLEIRRCSCKDECESFGLKRKFFVPPSALNPKAKEIKAEMNKWDLIKLKSFCTAKELIDKTKRQPTEWKKVFANDMTDKGLIFKMYKRFIPLSIKKNLIKT